MGGRCFIPPPPPSHPPLFSLASSPCSRSIPLPTGAESPGSDSAAQPTQSCSLPELDRSRRTGAALCKEPPRRAYILQMPSLCRSSHLQEVSHVPSYPHAQTWGCCCHLWCMHPCTSTSPVHLLGIHRHHSGTTGRYQLVSVTGAPIRTVVWVMTRVSSVSLKPLRFMCALKCFAMSAPWLWGWDSSH